MELLLSTLHIVRVDVGQLNMPFSQPIKTPIGSLDAARNVVVKITTNTGSYGWGEGSPMEQITGDSQSSNYAMAKKMAALLIGKDPLAINARMSELNALTVGDSSVRSAFDIALHDLAAKTANMPLYQYLGGQRRELRTNMTIGMQDTVEQTRLRTRALLDAGFDAIKLKVGRPGLADVAHVAAVRELAGPDVSIKIDSNQGWDYPTAVNNLRAMAGLNLQYSEQPLPVWDYDNLVRLRRTVDLPLCADESVFTHHDALKLVKAGAVDYLNIKLGKAGGICTGLKINAIAEAAGIKCMIGCFGESRLGLSAAAHLAMARPNITFLDLDSACYFNSDPVLGGMQYDKTAGGLLHIADTPGLGAEIDPAHVAEPWYVEL